MIICVGSKNPVKVSAVKEVIGDYFLRDSALYGVEVDSGVSKEPMSLEETVNGAANRARKAFEMQYCDYGFGIESGLMPVPMSRSGYVDICACMIFDGFRTSLGLSCAFEFPQLVIDIIKKDKVDANEAFFRSGLTDDKELGYGSGAIGLLTNGRVTRIDYTKQAIQMALIQVEKRALYL
ncbi:inosine/xanthosine triphosphatase [Candidatus Pacearchaeota archaeon]|nr:inosine/xanthosine triphosphatase [Candidatus Pacearchaeota archaeon]